MHLVSKIAMSYRCCGLPINELVSEGYVGLMKAVMRFDPDCEFSLATLAMWWIRFCIQEYVRHS
jgi:RNA polymerase sigma-32 factor